MSSEKQPIKIKKYANRRLYNTGTSTYVTLEDLAKMVKEGEDFAVVDAKSGDDITRPVLTQIIFEQEGKEGQENLLPTAFLRQLIRFYGDSMQLLVPRYLEFSFGKFVEEQQKLRDHVRKTMGGSVMGGSVMGGQMMGPGGPIFEAVEEQTRKNMAIFTQAFSLFNPFAINVAAKAADAGPAEAPAAAAGAPDIEVLKQQLDEMQRRLEAISKR